MAESFLSRARRVISAGVETAVDAAERASGESLMREAIREVERAADKLRKQSAEAEAKRLHASQQQRDIADQLKTLGEQARFALEKGRDDLAKAVVARQIELEAETARLVSVQAEAAKEKNRLEADAVALDERKAAMDQDYAAVIAARRAAEVPGHKQPTHKVERAEAAFERATANAGAGNGLSANADTARKLAEIEAAQKEAAVEERLAALREKKAPKGRKSRG